MIHDACGYQNLNSSCMIEDKSNVQKIFQYNITIRQFLLTLEGLK